jgi:hypothetical protein
MRARLASEDEGDVREPAVEPFDPTIIAGRDTRQTLGEDRSSARGLFAEVPSDAQGHRDWIPCQGGSASVLV